MSDTALMAALAAVERSADDPSTLHRPFLELFQVSGAAVSTVGELLGSETIAASDDLASRVDELQFDLGEGPCWDAMRFARPVLEPDVREHPTIVWPLFSAALMEHPVSSLFAFPLIVGPLRIGAVDLYSREPVSLSASQTKQASTVAEAVGQLVLRRALNAVGEYDDHGNAFSRRLIHQATGMLVAQLRIASEDAVLIIQGHAFATGQSMMEVSQSIVDRKLGFTHGANGIEVAP